jgi:hypothetical protein
MMQPLSPGDRTVGIVPVFNEAAVLPEFQRRLGAVIDSVGGSSENIYVYDGSRDDSHAILSGIPIRMSESPSLP